VKKYVVWVLIMKVVRSLVYGNL